MTSTLVAWLVALLLASAAFRRARPSALLLCDFGILAAPFLFAHLLVALERNLGPGVGAVAFTFRAVGVVGLLIRLTGRAPSRPLARSRRATSIALAGLAFLVMLATARKRTPSQEPDLLPLVDLASAPVDGVTADGPTLEGDGRRSDPACQLTGCYERCVTTLRDGHDASRTFSSDAYSLSASWMCSAGPAFTIDPSRHIVYSSTATFLASSVEGWRYPGLSPASSTIHTCRLGRLRVAPLDWLAAAWIAVLVGSLLGWRAARLEREAHARFAHAEQAVHEGDGVVLLADGERIRVDAPGDLLRGAVTVLFSAPTAAASAGVYRDARRVARVVEASLEELKAPPAARASLLRVAAATLVFLGLVPMIVALLAGLIFS